MGNLSLECPVCGKGIGIMELPDFLDDARTIFCCGRCGKMKNLISTEPGNARRYFSKYSPQEIVVEKINALFEREGVISPYVPGGEVTEEEINGVTTTNIKVVEPGELSTEVSKLKEKVSKLQITLGVSFGVEVIILILLLLQLAKK